MWLIKKQHDYFGLKLKTRFTYENLYVIRVVGIKTNRLNHYEEISTFKQYFLMSSNNLKKDRSVISENCRHLKLDKKKQKKETLVFCSVQFSCFCSK
jgi:hypothetical protein